MIIVLPNQSQKSKLGQSNMKIQCPSCDQRLEIPEELAGQTIECPACNASLSVPAIEAHLAATPKVQAKSQRETFEKLVPKRKGLAKPKATSHNKPMPQIPKWAIVAVSIVVVGLLIILFSGANHPPNAIHGAVNVGDIKLVKKLLDDGVDVNQQFVMPDGSILGATPLHNASNSKEIAELLISKGANVNAECDRGRTPLHEAAYIGSLSVVKLLIEKGADVNALDNQGRTPKDVAFIGIQSDKDFESFTSRAKTSRKIKEKEEHVHFKLEKQSVV